MGVVNSLIKNLGLKISSIIVSSLIFYSLTIPYLTPYDPRSWNIVPRDLPPSSKYIFGTTSMGQDVFVLTAWALRNSLTLGALAAAILILIAFMIGSLAGNTRSPILRSALTYLIDSFCIIPFLPIIILAGSLWGAQLGIMGVAILIGVLGWGGQARNIRSVVMGLRERMFVHTAVFSGYGTLRLLYKTYLPYIIRWLSIAFIFGIIFSIGLETTLSIFGITSLENPTIGTILFWTREYQAYLRGLWWWYTFPLTLLIILLSVTYVIAQRLIDRLAGGV